MSEGRHLAILGTRSRAYNRQMPKRKSMAPKTESCRCVGMADDVDSKSFALMDMPFHLNGLFMRFLGHLFAGAKSRSAILSVIFGEKAQKTLYLPVCRNWQTRQTQNLLSAMACGFESHHRHHESGSQNLYLCGLGAIFILSLQMRTGDIPPFYPQWLACRSYPDGHKYLPLC